jgi:hypothetical protein
MKMAVTQAESVKRKLIPEGMMKRIEGNSNPTIQDRSKRRSIRKKGYKWYM